MHIIWKNSRPVDALVGIELYLKKKHSLQSQLDQNASSKKKVFLFSRMIFFSAECKLEKCSDDANNELDPMSAYNNMTSGDLSRASISVINILHLVGVCETRNCTVQSVHIKTLMSAGMDDRKRKRRRRRTKSEFAPSDLLILSFSSTPFLLHGLAL